ncbi:LipA a lipoprotein [Rhodopseudomonas palustris HaA2]|uniref:LipA a lipoprotein n=1 Tax=Rhodopseudomonas palustris (strain HaA2) TaxID=316058 RepID=Q2IUG2_RHOP2|nr:RT0821/Lpp0805 family surface protein [Rhodopseudomonas palustris]ABD08148.1 LipA a lipoprotein [Rhodopseudomonas palustris HaA2]
MTPARDIASAARPSARLAKPSSAALLLLGALALAGCDRTTNLAARVDSFASNVAPDFGRSGDGAAAAVDNAAMGGLIGPKIGALLNAEDRRLAYAAELEALDHGESGAPVPWKNPSSGRYGNIVPGPAYAKQGATCRGFSHSVTVGRQLEIARGTACRTNDGPWTAAG